MPQHHSRRLTGKNRSLAASRHLGFALTAVAGAITAGGFLAVHQYTSHYDRDRLVDRRQPGGRHN